MQAGIPVDASPAQPAGLPTSTGMELATVSVSSRLPEFWPDQPRHWFIQIEAILNPQKISDQNKYDLAVGKLTKDAISQIADLLLDPPPTGKFMALKERLLSIYEESATRQLQKLLSEMELGDQKPSQLLRKMRELARGKVPDETLRILWQNHLPSSARAVLAVTESKNIDNLAKTADTVLEATRSVQISEVAVPSTSHAEDRILAEISKLTTQLANLKGGYQERYGRSRQRGRGGFRNFNRHRSSSRGSRGPRPDRRGPNWLCHYHYRFRDRANRCEQPCAWKKQPEN